MAEQRQELTRFNWIPSGSELLRCSVGMDENDIIDGDDENARKNNLFEDFMQQSSTPRCDLACQSIVAWQRTLDFWMIPEDAYPDAYWRLLTPTDFEPPVRGQKKRGNSQRHPLETTPVRRTVANRVRALRRAIAQYHDSNGFLRCVLAAFTATSVVHHYPHAYLPFRTQKTSSRFDVVADWCIRMDRFDLLLLMHHSTGTFPKFNDVMQKTLITAAVRYDSIRCLRGLNEDARFAGPPDDTFALKDLHYRIIRLQMSTFGLDLYVLAAACQSVKCLDYYLKTVNTRHHNLHDLFWVAYVGANAAAVFGEGKVGVAVAPRAEIVQMFSFGAEIVGKVSARGDASSILRNKVWAIDGNVRRVLGWGVMNWEFNIYGNDDGDDFFFA